MCDEKQKELRKAGTTGDSRLSQVVVSAESDGIVNTQPR